MAGHERAELRHSFESAESQFREIEVLENAAKGSSNKQIGQAMGISEQTVKNYLVSIMRKLAVNDRTHAVVYALQHGWINLPQL